MWCRQTLTSPDGYLQPALLRRIGTVVTRVEQAERVIRAVEIQIVDAAGGPLEIEIAPALVGFDAVGDVAKGHEQAPHVFLVRFDEGAEGQRLTLERESERADATHLPALA